MKKVFILLAVFCIIAVQSFGQQAAPAADKMQKPEGMAGQKFESWKSLLGLTDDQDAKMKEVGKVFKEKSDAIRNDAALEKADKKTKMTALQASNETDLKAILSADQFTKYMDIRKQRAEAKKAQQAGEKAVEKKDN